MSRVSVLIPNYQGEKWLKTTIQSCLQQEDLLEIIVVDDGSVDKSVSLLEEFQLRYPKLVRVYKNDLKGGNNARNCAFSHSKGEFIQWLDSDDQIREGKFTAQIGFLDKNEHIDIVYSDWELLIYGEGFKRVEREVKKNKPRTDFLMALLMDKWSPPNCYLMRRAAAEKLHEVKAWNPETQVFQDREYFTIAAILGFRFGYTAGIFATYNRWNRKSVSAIASRGMKYSTLEYILNRFENMILDQRNIFEGGVEEYLDIIHMEKILLRALGHPAKIDSGIEWKKVKWSRINGIRTNIKFCWQNVILKLK
jgi:glycosyltransferase involved in cell wall biosynthesis